MLVLTQKYMMMLKGSLYWSCWHYLTVAVFRHRTPRLKFVRQLIEINVEARKLVKRKAVRWRQPTSLDSMLLPCTCATNCRPVLQNTKTVLHVYQKNREAEDQSYV
jgi:hypothetical protein